MNCLFIGNFLHRGGMETVLCRLGTGQLERVSANLLTLLMEPPCTTLTQIRKERKSTHTRKEILNLREILLAMVALATELYYGTRWKELATNTQYVSTVTYPGTGCEQHGCGAHFKGQTAWYGMLRRAWDQFFGTAIVASCCRPGSLKITAPESVKANLERMWNWISLFPCNCLQC